MQEPRVRDEVRGTRVPVAGFPVGNGLVSDAEFVGDVAERQAGVLPDRSA